MRLHTGYILPLCLLAATAYGAEAVGYVKTASGDAQVVDNGAAKPATVGTPLAVGDVLRTGKNGNLGVTLKDNTVMSFGPATEFKLEAYLFAPAKGDLKLDGKLSKGTLQFVSGTIAKLRPEAVSLKTPSATIGVRGTRFLLKVDE